MLDWASVMGFIPSQELLGSRMGLAQPRSLLPLWEGEKVVPQRGCPFGLGPTMGTKETSLNRPQPELAPPETLIYGGAMEIVGGCLLCSRPCEV